MPLTDKQKQDIYNLDSETIIEILDECKERLGLVSQTEYCEIMHWDKSRQTLVNDIKSGKIKSWILGKVRYLIIND